MRACIARQASRDKTLRSWDVASWAPLHTLAHPAEVLDVAWSPDDLQLASGSSDGHVRLWDAASGERVLEILDHPGGVTALAWSTRGQLATGRRDGTIRLWDLAGIRTSHEELAEEVRRRTGLRVDGLDVVRAAPR